ncbi:MAG TPA: hypothetical protein VN426_09230 [Syntrophomonadaceae bacterium]|nr:hypothetical protein [Syntrophomonadaceae bacterium]
MKPYVKPDFKWMDLRAEERFAGSTCLNCEDAIKELMLGADADCTPCG